jgi:hypothetical protein
MRAVAWSLLITAVAAAVFLLRGRDLPPTEMRWMAVSGGALLALAGVLVGALGAGGVPAPAAAPPSGGPGRFFRDRRRSPRHAVEVPVRLTIDGFACEATLVSVSASGALLRWRGDTERARRARVGQPVTIQDYPAGTLARVGPNGLYVDFAVAFDRTPPPPALATAEHSASRG